MGTFRRRTELDGLRGLAVLLMLGQHLMVWLWDHNPGPTAPLLQAISAAGGLAAPLFVTLAGCGSVLGHHFKPEGFVRRSLARAVAMWILACLLSLATPSWFTLRSFYVLHLLAVGLAIAPLCTKLSKRALWLAIALVALLTPLWLQLFEIPLSLSNDWMSARRVGPGLVAQALATGIRALVGGHFPIFPWLIPFLLGCIAGKTIVASEPASYKPGLGMLVLGAALVLVSALGAIDLPRSSWLSRLISHQMPFFPCSPALCLALGGAALMLIALAETRPQLFNWLEPLGRISLTILMLHLPIFRELTRPFDLWRGVSGPATLAIMATTMCLSQLLAKRWQRYGYRYGAEWLLRQADRV